MIRAILIFCFTVWASAASAQFFTGNQMNDFCKTKRTAVSGYVAGASDVASLASLRVWLFIHLLSDDEKKRHQNKLSEIASETAGYCAPKEATLGQTTDVYCNYLSSRPQLRHKSAQELLNSALTEAWPCPGNQK